MLNLNNISKSFLQRGLVLDNLCLEVNEGDSIAIMGPSGSGKTTLMNILGLLEKPDSGEVTFRGSSILSFSEDESAFYRSRNIGFVFQDHLLLPYLTVRENILLPLMAVSYSSEERSNREQELENLIIKTGISDLAGKFPYEISGGEAQRVAMVRALSNNPSVILADEPTGSLDASNASVLGELLLDINKESGTALIIATHSSGLAAKMSQLLQLTDGKLIRVS